MKKVTHIKPDAAMVYAGLRIRLRQRGMPAAQRREIQTRARHLRGALTEFELIQAEKLIGETP